MEIVYQVTINIPDETVSTGLPIGIEKYMSGLSFDLNKYFRQSIEMSIEVEELSGRVK